MEILFCKEICIDKNFSVLKYDCRPQPEPPRRAEPADLKAGGEPQALVNGEGQEQRAAPAEGNHLLPYLIVSLLKACRTLRRIGIFTFP